MSLRTMDLPFDGVTNRFIVFYVQYKDLEKAAKTCHIPVRVAKQIYRRPDVRVEIDKQLNLFFLELAKLEAQAMYLTESRLDSKLVQVIEDEKTVPSVVVRAVEIGYKKLGLVKDKVEHTGENGGALVFTLEHIQPKKKGE